MQEVCVCACALLFCESVGFFCPSFGPFHYPVSHFHASVCTCTHKLLPSTKVPFTCVELRTTGGHNNKMKGAAEKTRQNQAGITMSQIQKDKQQFNRLSSFFSVICCIVNVIFSCHLSHACMFVVPVVSACTWISDWFGSDLIP